MQTGELGADGRAVHNRSSISYARLPPTLLLPLLLLLLLLPLLLLLLRLLLLLLLLLLRRRRCVAQLPRLVHQSTPWCCICMHLNSVCIALLPLLLSLLLPLLLFLLLTLLLLLLLRLSSAPARNPSRRRPPLPLPAPGRLLPRTPGTSLFPEPCLRPQPRPCLCHLTHISLLAHLRSLPQPLPLLPR